VAGDRVVVIEANPRASRTVPIVAKATGRDVVADAVRCALGASLAEVGLAPGLAADARLVAVKAPVGSLWRLPGVEATLGPEMRSTGEVLGLAATYTEALDAARRAEAAHLAPGAEPAVPVLEPSGQR
jgi:carbamoyl-phosphate synthase large subunit